MSRPDRTLQLRAQQIVNDSAEPISIRAAMRQALLERYKDDFDGLVDMASAVSASSMNGLRKRTYELPEDEDTLFDIPSLIVVSTPDGDLFVPRDQADTSHTRQWVIEGRRYHSVQTGRFERFKVDLDQIDDLDGHVPWAEARQTLGDRKKAIEAEGGEW